MPGRRGGGSSGGSTSSGGGLTPTALKTAAYTAAAGDLVRVDSSGTSRMVTDVAQTNASPIITSATAAFTQADVGAAASGLGFNPGTTILSVQSGTQATLSSNSIQTATAQTMIFGTAGVAVTLPASAPVGAIVAIKKLDASSKPVTVLPSGADTIDGLASATLGHGRRYASRRFLKDSGTTWVVDAGLTPETPPRGPIVNWIGDSISPQATGSAHSLNGSGSPTDYLWWAHLLSQGKLLHGKVAGIGSTRGDHMATRIYDQALSEGGHFCGIQTGTNDVSFGRTVAQYAADIRSMVAAIQAAGQIPVLTTPCPIPVTSGRAVSDQYRRFIVSYANANGFPLIDFWSLLFDYTTGTYSAAYDSGDHTHPNNAGKQAMGQLISDTLLAYLPPFQSPAELLNSNVGVTGSSSLLSNGLFQTDTNSDGVPDGWTKAGTQTYSLVADAAIKGQALRIQDSASSGFSQVTTNNLTGTTSGKGGHRIAFTGLVKVDAASVGPNVQVSLGSPTTPVLLRALGVFNALTPGWQRFYCEGTAPSDCNGISVTVSSNGGTSLDARVAQLGVYDLTASGL
jgi:lysophospholipase L1-like esterase